MAVVLVGIGFGGGEARAERVDLSEFLETPGSSRQLTKTTGPSKADKAAAAAAPKRAKKAPKRVAKKAGAKSRATKRAVRSKRRR